LTRAIVNVPFQTKICFYYSIIINVFSCNRDRLKVKALHCSAVAILLASILSSCSTPSATICGVEVREGGKTKIKANESILSKLIQIEKGKNSSDASYSIGGGSMEEMTVLSWFQIAGLGTDGNSVVLRSAKDWQNSAPTNRMLESLCEK